MKDWIGLVGYAQTGKDTAAEALAELGYVRVAFADGLRRALYNLNPLVQSGDEVVYLRHLVDACGWDRAKTECEDVRELLQRMGTEAGRDIHGEDCWVDLGIREAEKHDKVVFTDVRFPNEAAAVRRWGGGLIRIERPGTGPVNSHVSDQGLAQIACDETWTNDFPNRFEWQAAVLEALKTPA